MACAGGAAGEGICGCEAGGLTNRCFEAVRDQAAVSLRLFETTADDEFSHVRYMCFLEHLSLQD